MHYLLIDDATALRLGLIDAATPDSGLETVYAVTTAVRDELTARGVEFIECEAPDGMPA